MAKATPNVYVNNIFGEDDGEDYEDCFSPEDQSDYEDVNPIHKSIPRKLNPIPKSSPLKLNPNTKTSPLKTNINIAHNKQSIQGNSESQKKQVPWQLLLLITCFLITIAATYVVTYFTTKQTCSKEKTQRPTPCSSFPCLNLGSCYESAINYTCVCPNGTEGSNCQDTFYETIASPGYPSNYNNTMNKTWIINVGFDNTIRIKFTHFGLESDYDYLKIYDGPTTQCCSVGNYTGYTLPDELTSTGRYMTMVFTSDGSETNIGFRTEIYKRTSK